MNKDLKLALPENESAGKRVAFMTLGCKLNYSETSSIARVFVKNGFVKVPASHSADIYVINTCSVTEHADKKCRGAIRKLHRQNPDAIVAVTGCYAQLKPDEILGIEGVDIVLGADQKENLFMKVSQLHGVKEATGEGRGRAYSCAISEVETIFPAYSSDERTRSFLKVQDGCDYHCSYCTIPLARGKSRNLSVDFLIKEAREIAVKGIKEIVLTGVNTGDFGKSTGESFLDLLKALENVEGIERYRISSIEPNLLTEEVLAWISQSRKFLHHFHIPLQSGSDKILALMRRRYNTTLFRDKISRIRHYMPDSFIGIDVIVGFPGEGEAEFEECRSLLEELKPAFIHIFPYSRRANTPAAEMENQVDEQVKHSRVLMLETLCERLHAEFVGSMKGKREYVLFESTRKGGMMYGFTRNYIKVERPYDRTLIGEISEVIL
ncbi:MAG: tRNA (N(6)-L-threonylcarbamoyladenosine(37)-C(2))-methylthiotransferase MtaB [Bacteroidales bacterium]|nr:tRNA (N(6)-L-threonylcarbamoyladenosine(37)-C(2))-methylthiotransferase MtaB [Bacteroidales bacterium]